MKSISAAIVVAISFLLGATALGSEPFDIVIKRISTKDTLVSGIISLNGVTLGASYENDSLKIPAGKYRGLIRYVSNKSFAQSELGRLSQKGDFLIEVSNVKGKTNVLLHSGNKPHHSTGCILLGPALKGPGGSALVNDDHPLRKLRIAFYGTEEPTSTPDKNISITIVDESK